MFRTSRLSMRSKKRWAGWLIVGSFTVAQTVSCATEGWWTVVKPIHEMASAEEIEQFCGGQTACDDLCSIIQNRSYQYEGICAERGDASRMQGCQPAGESVRIDCYWEDAPSGCRFPSG